MTRALAVERAPVRVNMVCAGVVNTSLWDNMPEQNKQDFFAQVASNIPAGRVGEAEDIARVYLYLMQQEFTTGQFLVVNGGSVLV